MHTHACTDTHVSTHSYKTHTHTLGHAQLNYARTLPRTPTNTRAHARTHIYTHMHERMHTIVLAQTRVHSCARPLDRAPHTHTHTPSYTHRQHPLNHHRHLVSVHITSKPTISRQLISLQFTCTALLITSSLPLPLLFPLLPVSQASPYLRVALTATTEPLQQAAATQAAVSYGN